MLLSARTTLPFHTYFPLPLLYNRNGKPNNAQYTPTPFLSAKEDRKESYKTKLLLDEGKETTFSTSIILSDLIYKQFTMKCVDCNNWQNDKMAIANTKLNIRCIGKQIISH